MLLQASILVILPALVLSDRVVQLRFGRAIGLEKQAQDSNKTYYAFLAIRYAKAPIKELRFQPPQPPVFSRPDAIITSNKYGPACVQNDPSSSKAVSEDCLFLNVYVPDDVSELKTVMFFIYGGSFQTGDGRDFIPSKLATKFGVIVVVLNYRVGMFGFLTSHPGDANNGLNDQISALKWTKDNIHAFGGDPNNITVIGESAGAASASFLSTSPLTKGLFKRAIFQSGTILSGWALNPKPTVALDLVAANLNCTSPELSRRKRSKEQIDCIRKKSLDQLRAVAVSDPNNVETQFLPVVDGNLIPASPECLVANATYLKLIGALDRDYLVGFTNNEGMILIARALAQAPGVPASLVFDSFTAPETAEGLVKQGYGLAYPKCPLTKCKLQLLNYQYTQPRDKNGHTPLQNVIDLVSHSLFVMPSIRFVRAMSKASIRTIIYLYLFDVYLELIDPSGPLKGSTHGADLSYEFDRGPVNELISFYAKPPQPQDYIIELFLGSLSGFAKNGTPSVASSGLEPTKWPKYNLSDEHFYRFSSTPSVGRHVYARPTALWIDLLKGDCDSCRGNSSSLNSTKLMISESDPN